MLSIVGVVEPSTAVACRPSIDVAAEVRREPKRPKIDPRYPFRTDFANAHLPWYQPKPGEFPPHHSDHRVSGELVSADFIHRTGQFRTSQDRRAGGLHHAAVRRGQSI